jgi:photosystem II stability/assembly factor-like uncharacterized protein
LPRWLDGICDTGNIAVLGAVIAIADQGGNVYLSEDEGGTWARRAQNLPTPSCLLMIP